MLNLTTVDDLEFFADNVAVIVKVLCYSGIIRIVRVAWDWSSCWNICLCYSFEQVTFNLHGSALLQGCSVVY